MSGKGGLMKTPTNIGGNNLVTWLQTATEIRMADLYTITLKNGTALRYTTWDTNLTVLGNTFLTGPPNIARSAIEEKLGMEVSTLELTLEASLTDTINGVPILQADGSEGAILLHRQTYVLAPPLRVMPGCYMGCFGQQPARQLLRCLVMWPDRCRPLPPIPPVAPARIRRYLLAGGETPGGRAQGQHKRRRYQPTSNRRRSALPSPPLGPDRRSHLF
jgi:hypothetical protein